jgi:hypothetical protein
MEVLQYYDITFFVLIAIAFWLRRQGRGRSRFARALYILIGLQLLGIALSLIIPFPLPGNWLVLAVQLVAWAVLLWGISLDGRFILGLVVVAILAAFFPTYHLHSFLAEGFVMALAYVSAFAPGGYGRAPYGRNGDV